MPDEQIYARYARQICLPELGSSGQEKLLSSSVLICGCGGLGSPVALYLAAMGIGHIGLVDSDEVAWSNLNRQLLYTPADLGKSKVACAAERLRQFNPDIEITAYPLRLDALNIVPIIKGYDIMVDCLDNLESRFILNDACIKQRKPFIHAGVAHLSGQIMTVIPGKSPCLRCLLPQGHKESTANKGIIGATAGVMGSLQATEVYKYLLNLNINDEGLLIFDGWDYCLNHLNIKPDPACFCQKNNDSPLE